MTNENDEFAVRRRRALYRAAHRGTKEMDWLLGRFAQAVVERMNEHRLLAFEQLIVAPDTEIELAIKGGAPLGQADLDTLISELRSFHGLPS